MNKNQNKKENIFHNPGILHKKTKSLTAIKGILFFILGLLTDKREVILWQCSNRRIIQFHIAICKYNISQYLFLKRPHYSCVMVLCSHNYLNQL